MPKVIKNQLNLVYQWFSSDKNNLMKIIELWNGTEM